MSVVDDGRTVEYRGIRFRTVGKGIRHCQTCLRVTHNYVSHAAWHATGVGDLGWPAVSPLEPGPTAPEVQVAGVNLDRPGSSRVSGYDATGDVAISGQSPALARATEALIDRSDAYDPDEVIARAVVRAALRDPDDPAWLPNVIAAAIRDFHSGPSSQPIAACVADAVQDAILGARGGEAS